MSWVTDDGRHEGYAALITKDGREAHGSRQAGMLMETGHYDATGTWQDGEITPWSELLGWEARCDHDGKTCWAGPMWRRPTGADMQDASELDLSADYPPGTPSIWGGDHMTAEDAIYVAWSAHVDAHEARRAQKPEWAR